MAISITAALAAARSRNPMPTFGGRGWRTHDDRSFGNYHRALRYRRGEVCADAAAILNARCEARVLAVSAPRGSETKIVKQVVEAFGR